MTGGGHLRRRQNASQFLAAQQAKDLAVQAFYDMDRLQRDAQIRVEAYLSLAESTARSRAIRDDFAALTARANAVSAEYITSLDTTVVDERSRAEELLAAQSAFSQITTRISAVGQEMTSFLDRNGQEFARVDAAMAQLGPSVAAAVAAVEKARAAAEALRREYGTTAADESLARLETAAKLLSQGVGTLGMAGALQQAKRTSELAAETMSITRTFPSRVADLRTRYATLTTKRQALVTRAERVSSDLHALRTGFSERSWADLTRAEEELAEHLGQAQGMLQNAQRAQAGNRWDEFVAAVRSAEHALAAASGIADSVIARRRDLEEVKADPPAEMAKARFKVRDAQRLVMRGREAPPQPWATRLDALSERLDRAEQSIKRVHPDYWGYLTELRAVVQATAAVVSDFRQGHP